MTVDKGVWSDEGVQWGKLSPLLRDPVHRHGGDPWTCMDGTPIGGHRAPESRRDDVRGAAWDRCRDPCFAYEVQGVELSMDRGSL